MTLERYEAHSALGNKLVQLGKLDAAITSYEQALALRPDMAEIHYNLGRALRKQGRLEEAEAAYRRAIAIDPNYAKAHADLGKILFGSNRIKEAFQSFTRFAELSYGDPASNVLSNEPIFPHKLRHDQEQQDYLASIGIRDNATRDIFHLADGGQLVEPALNPKNTDGEVSERWRRSSPKIVVIDDFLTNEALDGLRRFCWGRRYGGEFMKPAAISGRLQNLDLPAPCSPKSSTSYAASTRPCSLRTH